jgi:hypothetical protein
MREMLNAWLHFRHINKGCIKGMSIFLPPKIIYVVSLVSPVVKVLHQLEVEHPDLHEPPFPINISRSSAENNLLNAIFMTQGI